MTWTHSIPQPPVPQGIREALKDYPELIRIVQDDLSDLVADLIRRRATFSAFEEAIWALEAAFSSFYSDAKEQLEAAEIGGNQQAIERAKAKRYLIGSIRMDAPWNDDGEGNLWDYFQAYRGAFE